MPVQGIGQFHIWNQLAPVQPDGSPGDPACLRVLLDFTVDTIIAFDLMQQVAANEIGFVQFAYIDNGANAAALTLVSKVLEQTIKVKANTQGWYPILAADPPQFVITTTPALALIIPIFFVNVAMPAFQWSTV